MGYLGIPARERALTVDRLRGGEGTARIPAWPVRPIQIQLAVLAACPAFLDPGWTARAVGGALPRRFRTSAV